MAGEEWRMRGFIGAFFSVRGSFWGWGVRAFFCMVVMLLFR